MGHLLARGGGGLFVVVAREPGHGRVEGSADRPDCRAEDPARARRPVGYDCRERGTVVELRAGARLPLGAARNPVQPAIPLMTLRVGIGGPVGSGKTALTLALCRALRDRYQIAVVTNDIYTEEDAQFLVRNEALEAERIIGVETGGCPHTAIREDASINPQAGGRRQPP